MALIQYLLFVKVFPRSISGFTRKAAAFAQCKNGNPTDERTFLGYKKLFKRVYVHEVAHKKLGITHLIRAAHGASAWRN